MPAEFCFLPKSYIFSLHIKEGGGGGGGGGQMEEEDNLYFPVSYCHLRR